MPKRLIVATTVALLFAGCDGPSAVEGEPGAPGANQVTLRVPGMNERLKIY